MIRCEDGRCRIEGAVTMANVTALREQGLTLFTAPQVSVDLEGVTEVDSSAVSLLFEWRRAALAANRRITFENLPANLKSLAALYGVGDLLSAE